MEFPGGQTTWFSPGHHATLRLIRSIMCGLPLRLSDGTPVGPWSDVVQS